MDTHPYRAVMSPVLIRVYFHICRDNDGTNAAATEANIESEFNQLVTDYAPDNICFANMGLDYVNNTHINTTFFVDDASDVALLNSYSIPRCINIFYQIKLQSADNTWGGWAYNIPNTFCSVAKGNIGSTQKTVSHEVGHCFGLLHTFQDCEKSYIDGTKCNKKGDHVCDTRADPYCFNQDACFSTSGCSYTGSCQDADGKTNWSPPYNNIMSYWGKFNCNITSFTPGQYDRMNGYLITNDSLLLRESADNLALGDRNLSSGVYIASAIDQLSASGDFNVSGTAYASLAAQHVLFEPGFHAVASGDGKLSVKGTPCNYSLPGPIAKTNLKNAIQTRDERETNKQQLRAYPNPTAAFVNIEFDLARNENNASLEIYDMSGLKVKEVSPGSLLAGKQKISINLSSLSAGMYDVRLLLSSTQFNTKVMLVK